ncbi:MAG: type II secretion system F family protein [Candidatus Absconditicoccaceae bacterium]
MEEKKNTYQKHGIDKLILGFLRQIDKGSFGSKEKVIFFKQLAYLINGGVALSEAMNIIETSSENYAVKEIARSVNRHLIQGKELSYAFNRLPDYFDERDYSIVKAGERSGNIVIILKSLADEYTYMNEIRNKYILSLTYPIILIVVSIVAIISLFAFVLPGIFEIANSFQNIELPTITMILKNIADAAKENRQSMIWIFVSFITILLIFISTDTGKKARFSVVLKIPILGKLTKYYYLIKRCRYTKIMLQSGMNYIETFQLLRDILNIPIYQGMIERTLVGLQKGETIYDTIKYQNELIPSNVSALIKVGEETANLQSSLDNILTMHEEELNNNINRLAKVIEPIILIFIGVIVVVIALGVFGLILQIMEGVGV